MIAVLFLLVMLAVMLYAAATGQQALPIVQYQLAQTGLAEIEARIVAARPFTAEEEAELRAIVTGPVGAEGCAVRIVYRDAIPRLPSGKYEDFVCEIV